MAGFVVRMALNILGLWVADNLVAGIEIRDAWSFVMAGFVLVVNAGMLGLAAALVGGFYVSGFWAAFFGSLVVSLTSWGASFLIGPGGSFEYLEMNER